MVDVIGEANVIVRGVVDSNYVDYEASGSGRIMTFTKIIVEEVLKGTLTAKEITVRQPGGAKDGVEMRVAGTAEFQAGEEVVLLLGAFDPSDRSYSIPGMATGKYFVERRSSGEEILVNSLGSEEIYRRSGDESLLSYTSRVSLDVFRAMARGTPPDKKTSDPVPTAVPTHEAVNSAEAIENDEAHLPQSQTPDSASQQHDSNVGNSEPFSFKYLVLISVVAAGAIGLWYRRRCRGR